MKRPDISNCVETGCSGRVGVRDQKNEKTEKKNNHLYEELSIFGI